jgi:alkylation response protein AidB-like acyl-CoA dehydrogenase
MYVLNGTSSTSSRTAPVRSWYVVFATARQKTRHQGITAFVLPADLPGISKHV